jgi:Cft2 family RNA processing exonuclease
MSRSLELSYLLETLWNTNRDLSRFGLFLLGYKSDAVISIAKRFLEWMEERIASSISQERALPFDLRSLHFFLSIASHLNGFFN